MPTKWICYVDFICPIVTFNILVPRIFNLLSECLVNYIRIVSRLETAAARAIIAKATAGDSTDTERHSKSVTLQELNYTLHEKICARQYTGQDRVTYMLKIEHRGNSPQNIPWEIPYIECFATCWMFTYITIQYTVQLAYN